MEKVNPGEIVNDQEQAASQIFQYVANMLMHEKLHTETAIDRLVNDGMNRETAETVVNMVDDKIRKVKREQATKNIIFGLLWCVGGIVATASGIGVIFWGAILFGGIQFIQGLVQLAD